MSKRSKGKKQKQVTSKPVNYDLFNQKLTFEFLKSHLWAAADILRGSLDPADYRQPIMTLLFIKRLNDTFEENAEKLINMNRCHIVQFVNNQLFKVRTTNIHFPKILLLPDEKDRVVWILEEDEDTIQSILSKVQNDRERGNIALRLWTGCLCVAKECRRTSVAEHNPDGTVKRESLYTPERRAKSFEKIIITSREDPIYKAGVEVAPVWELIENAAPDKKMYLDGIPNLNNSPVTKYLKDRNKIIISADDLEISK